MSKVIHKNDLGLATLVSETVDGNPAATVVFDSIPDLPSQFPTGLSSVFAPRYTYDIFTSDQFFDVSLAGFADASSSIIYQSGGHNLFRLTSTLPTNANGNFQLGSHGELVRNFAVEFTPDYRNDVTHFVGTHLYSTHTVVADLVAAGDLHTQTFWGYTNDGSEFISSGQYLDFVRIETWVGHDRQFESSTKLEFYLPTEGATSIGLLKRETDLYTDVAGTPQDEEERVEFTFGRDGTTVLLEQHFDRAGNLTKYHARNTAGQTLDATYDPATNLRTVLTGDPNHSIVGRGDLQDLINQPLWLIGNDGAGILVADNGAGFSARLIGDGGGTLIGPDGVTLIGDGGGTLIGEGRQ